MDVVVLSVSLARSVSGGYLPWSGHMLFLTYSALTTTQTAYRWFAALLVIETTWFKLLLWADPKTWSIGLVLGIVAAGASLKLRPRI